MTQLKYICGIPQTFSFIRVQVVRNMITCKRIFFLFLFLLTQDRYLYRKSIVIISSQTWVLFYARNAVIADSVLPPREACFQVNFTYPQSQLYVNYPGFIHFNCLSSMSLFYVSVCSSIALTYHIPVISLWVYLCRFL